MTTLRVGALTGVLMALPLVATQLVIPQINATARAAEPTPAAAPFQLAQAPQTTPAQEEERRKREEERKKQAPPSPPRSAPQPPREATPPAPPKAAAPAPGRSPAADALPAPPQRRPSDDGEQRTRPRNNDRGPDRVAPQQTTPAPKAPNERDNIPVRPQPATPAQAAPAAPNAQPSPPAAGAASGAPRPQGGRPVPATAVAPPHLQPAPQSVAPPPRFDQVQKQRTERVEDGGRRTVIQEVDKRTIIKQDNRVFIQHDEAERFRRLPGAQSDRRPDGIVETFYVRPDGVRIVTELDSGGRLLRRYRRGADGREFEIIDNRRYWRNAGIGAGIGAGVIGLAIALNLPPPVIDIPRERYIVDYERASDDDLYEALEAPPVQRLERAYSLEEVRYNRELREHMRRIDLDTITFEFGAFSVPPDEFGRLERLAQVIQRVLDRNPDEVFLIEGHTDAVGSDVDNLSLSDRRAGAVAQVLTETFGVPPENLVTQGYGKQYLKIDTPYPERANRRVAVRRITPLISDRR